MQARSRTHRSQQIATPPERARDGAGPSAPEFGGEWASTMQDVVGNQGVLGLLQGLTSVPQGPPDRATAAREGVREPGEAVPFAADMERSFGDAAAGVRAHSGPAAQEATRALGVQAFATGDDVAFGSRHPPKDVVAHEVAHVVQQRAGEAGLQGRGGPAGAGAWEREADRAADRAVSGETGLSADLSPATPGAVQGFNESSGSIDGGGFSSESGDIEGSVVPDTTVDVQPYQAPSPPPEQEETHDPAADYFDRIPGSYYDEVTKQEQERAEEVDETLDEWGDEAEELWDDWVPGEDAEIPVGPGGPGTAGLQSGRRVSVVVPIPITVEIGKSCKWFTIDSVTFKTEIKISEPERPGAENLPVDVNAGGGASSGAKGTRGTPSVSAKKAAETEWARWANDTAGSPSLKGEVEGEAGTGGLGLSVAAKFGNQDLSFKCPIKILNWEPKDAKNPLSEDNLEVLALEPELTAAFDFSTMVDDVELTWSTVSISLKLTPAYAELVKQLMVRAFGAVGILTTAFILGGLYTLWGAYREISNIPNPDNVKAEAEALTQDGVNGFISGLFGRTAGGGHSANGKYLLDSSQAGWAAREKAMEAFQMDPSLDGWDLDAMIARVDAALLERIDEYRSAAAGAVRPKAQRLVWDAWYAANRGERPSVKMAVAAGLFGVSVPSDVQAQAEETPGFFD